MARIGPVPDYKGIVAEARKAGYEPAFGRDEYDGRNSKASFRCLTCGELVTLRTRVIRDCPVCEKHSDQLARYKAAIKASAERGGRCLSEPAEATDWYAYLAFECHHGHRWQAQITNVVFNKSWCARCARSASARSRWEKFRMLKNLASSTSKY